MQNRTQNNINQLQYVNKNMQKLINSQADTNNVRNNNSQSDNYNMQTDKYNSQDNINSQNNKSSQNNSNSQNNNSRNSNSQNNNSRNSNSQNSNSQNSNSQNNSNALINSNTQNNNTQNNNTQNNSNAQIKNNSQNSNNSQNNNSQNNNSQNNNNAQINNNSQKDNSNMQKEDNPMQNNNDLNNVRKNDKQKPDQGQQEAEKVRKENEDLKDQKISEYGQTVLENGKKDHKIHLLSIIGEIEGHECLPQHNKTTKYEHVLPQLAAIEDSNEIDGLLILINTVGGDVEAGLAIAEMIASLSKPTVSLVLGGSHSIGVPLAVSANYSYIVPTATMIIHPVRMNGTVIGVTQTFEYFEKIQDRIIRFVVDHSKIDYNSFKNLMLDTNQLAKDVGSILVGEETVKKGIIDEVGGIKEALAKINEMIDNIKNDEKANS